MIYYYPRTHQYSKLHVKINNMYIDYELLAHPNDHRYAIYSDMAELPDLYSVILDDILPEYHTIAILVGNTNGRLSVRLMPDGCPILVYLHSEHIAIESQSSPQIRRRERIVRIPYHEYSLDLYKRISEEIVNDILY